MTVLFAAPFFVLMAAVGNLRAWGLGALGAAALALSSNVAEAQQRRCRVVEVQVSPPDAQVRVGATSPFLAVAYDAASNPCATATFTWTSSNPRAATVDQNGIATGVEQGVSIITARTGTGAAAKTGQATIQVMPVAPAQTQVQAPAQPPAQPQAQPQPQPQPQAPVQAQPEAARPAAPAARPGTGRPAGAGYAAFDRQQEGSGPAEALIIDPLRLTLVRGESRQLEYQSVKGDGTRAERVPIVFSVDAGGERVVMVDSVGFVTSLGDTGRTVVRATIPNHPRIQPKQIAVDVRGDSVRFERSQITLSPGAVDTVAVEVPQQDRVLNALGIFQFRSTDPAVVRVNLVAPIVEALTPGSAVVTAQSSVYEDMSVTVTVHRPVVAMAGTPADTMITIALQSEAEHLVALALGRSVAISVRALAADSTAVPDAPLRWQLPDSTIVRFDTTSNTLRGLRVGETRIAVSAPYSRDSSVTWSRRIRVVVGGLAVSRSRLGVGIRERTPIAVQLLDERRQPIGSAPEIDWRSTNDSVARVEDGHIVGRRVGRAQLVARAPWDSTASVEVYVVGDLLVPALVGGRWDLYMMKDSSVFVPVTQDTMIESQPAWAPDLTRIAYVVQPAARSRTQELFVANADGSDATRVTNDTAVVRGPAFVRPSGEQLVYESNRGGRPRIYVIGRDGSGARALTSPDYPSVAPSSSPDGRKVLFVSQRETSPGDRSYDVYEINLDGTGERRLTTSPRPEDDPAYAPDGRSIYYLRDEGGRAPTKRVYRQALESDSAVAIPVSPDGLYVQAFSLGADGNTLALTVLEGGPNSRQPPRVVLLNATTGVVTAAPTPNQLAGAALRP